MGIFSLVFGALLWAAAFYQSSDGAAFVLAAIGGLLVGSGLYQLFFQQG